MKILHVITGLHAGGAERLMADLAVEQAKHGHDVRVASLLGDEHFSSVLESAGIPVEDLGFRRRVPPIAAFWRTIRLIRLSRPDVVHASMLHAIVVSRVARILAPTPLVISTIQNVDETGNRERSRSRATLRQQLYRWTDRLSDLTSQVSPQGAAEYVSRSLVSAERMCFVPNATDTAIFRPDQNARRECRDELGVEPDEQLFINVGSFHPQKAQVELIHAFADAFSPPRHTLLIAGDGPLRPELESAISNRALEGHVRLLGVRRDVARLLNAADMFVLASNFEGMPLALLEAMACGKPSICTDVGANSMVAVDETTGWIIPPRSRESTIRALRSAASLPAAERKKMGSAGRSRVEQHFSVEAIAASWLAFYGQAEHQPSRLGQPCAHLAGDIWPQAGC